MKIKKMAIKIYLLLNAKRKKNKRKRNIIHNDEEKKNKTKNLGNFLQVDSNINKNKKII